MSFARTLDAFSRALELPPIEAPQPIDTFVRLPSRSAGWADCALCGSPFAKGCDCDVDEAFTAAIAAIEQRFGTPTDEVQRAPARLETAPESRTIRQGKAA